MGVSFNIKTAFNNYNNYVHSVFMVCLVLFSGTINSVSAVPHGHLHGILHSLKYGGGGGVSPTAIEGQAIVPFNGAGSYSGAGSYAESNAASFSSSKSGSFNIAGVAPFGLGINMGVSGAHSGSLAGATAGSGAFAGNQGGVHSQASPYISPSSSYNSPSGSGSYNSGSFAGSHAASGAISGADLHGGVGIHRPSDQNYNNVPSSGSFNAGIEVNKQVGYNDYKGQQNGNHGFESSGNIPTNTGSLGFAGSSANANAGAHAATLNGGTGNQNPNGGNIFSQQPNMYNGGPQKTEGSVVITDVQKVPSNSYGGTVTGSGTIGAGFTTLDDDYDRGFLTMVQPSKPTVTTMIIMKPDMKYPQTSYGYVPEGGTDVYVDGSIVKNNHKTVNKVPNNSIYNPGSTSPTYGYVNNDINKPTTTYHEMKVIVTSDKKPIQGTTFGTSNVQANSQAGAGSFAGHVGSGSQYPTKTQTTHIFTGPVTPDTGKYSGNFGGSPGILNEQKTPGYAVNKGITVGTTHLHGQSGTPSTSGTPTSGVYPGPKDAPHIGSGFNSPDTGKYSGGFGGGPGVLGDQKPPGYAVNKDVSHGATVGVAHSQGHAGAGSMTFSGTVAHPTNTPHTGSNYNTPGKYSGSFGGGPGVLGDQNPSGYAVNKGVSHGATFGVTHAQGHAGAGSMSISGAVGHPTNTPHTGSSYNTPDAGKYTGSFGGGPGILGDQKPPGYAVNKGVSHGVSIGVSHSQGQAGAGSTSFSNIGANPVHKETPKPSSNTNAGKYTGSFGGGPGVLGDQHPPGYAVINNPTIGTTASTSHTQANTGAFSGTHTNTNNNVGPGKYTGSFGGGPGVLGDQKVPGYAIKGPHNTGSIDASTAQAHAGASAGAGAFIGTGVNKNPNTGIQSYPGSGGISGQQNVGVSHGNTNVGGIKGTITLVETNKPVSNNGFSGNSGFPAAGSFSDAGAYAGASANAGAVAGAGTGAYGQNPHGLVDQRGHYNTDLHKTSNYNGNHGGSYGLGAANSGAYSGSGGIGIGIKKQGSLVGGLVGGMLNALGSAAVAGSQALSASHSGSLGLGGLGISGGVSSSYASAGASSGATSGCCG